MTSTPRPKLTLVTPTSAVQGAPPARADAPARAAPGPRKLTTKLLGSMSPGERIWDASVRGLYAEAGARGVALKVKGDLWRNGARVGTRSKVLGRFPGASLDDVRAQAQVWLGELKSGKDPATPGTVAASSWTVGTAVDRYLSDMATRECADITIEYTKARLETHLASWLDLPLASILPSMCQAEHARITTETGKVAANKTLRDFRALYNFARRKIDDPDALRGNPVESVTMHRERRREAVIHPQDVAAWLRKVRALGNPLRAAMHELGLFSGLRPGNLVRLRREWLDLDGKGPGGVPVIAIPAKAMKARREFKLPLSAHMVELVRRALEAGDVLFPASSGGHGGWLFPARARGERSTVIATSVWNERLLPSETGHILRHTWRTLAAAAGVVGTDAELLMAHAIPGVAGVYLHEGALLEHLRAQQERVTGHILSLVG